MSIFVILSLYLCNSLPCFYIVEEMEPRWDEVRQKKDERKRMREAGQGNICVCVRALSYSHIFYHLFCDKHIHKTNTVPFYTFVT